MLHEHFLFIIIYYNILYSIFLIIIIIYTCMLIFKSRFMSYVKTAFNNIFKMYRVSNSCRIICKIREKFISCNIFWLSKPRHLMMQTKGFLKFFLYLIFLFFHIFYIRMISWIMAIKNIIYIYNPILISINSSESLKN